MMESYESSLYHVLNIVVPDINMLGLVMKYEILLQSYPTLFFTIYHYRVQDMLKELSKVLP